MKEPQAKGINFRSFVGAVHRLLGAETLDKMLPLLPAELAQRIERDGFLTNGWYPLAHFRMLHGAAQKVTQRGPDLAREIAIDCAKDDFRGIYRVLTFVLTPEFLIRRTPNIWSRYYDTGKVAVVAQAKHAEAQFVEARGFDHVLWQDVIGGCQGVLEVCGAQDVVMTIVSGGGDEDHLSLQAEWR